MLDTRLPAAVICSHWLECVCRKQLPRVSYVGAVERPDTKSSSLHVYQKSKTKSQKQLQEKQSCRVGLYIFYFYIYRLSLGIFCCHNIYKRFYYTVNYKNGSKDDIRAFVVI